jgi:hypothetical protein
LLPGPLHEPAQLDQAVVQPSRRKHDDEDEDECDEDGHGDVYPSTLVFSWK